jgi:AraC family transcriptional regulator
MDYDAIQDKAPIMAASMKGGEATFKAERAWKQGAIYAAVKSWAGLDAELLHQRQHHTLVLTLSGGTDHTGTKISGSPTYEGKDRVGSLTFIPSGAERRAWYRNADLNFVVMLIDPTFLAHYDPDLGAGDLRPFTNHRDGLLNAALSSLAREMLRAGPDLPSLYAEHVAGLSISHLMRSARRHRSSRVSRTRLSDAQLRRVVEFIEANLHRNVSLSDLANLVGIVPDVLARKMKANIGASPYSFLLERRIRRAEMLLRSSDMPIAEIALEVGFSSQSHFTAQFRKLSNLTPGAYRAATRN